MQLKAGDDLAIPKVISKNNLLYFAPSIIFGISLIVFFIAYYPSRLITFRVEQWNFNYFYATQNLSLFSLRDLGTIAFWTPFGDFRFIPLAYLWLFLEYKAFGIHMQLYWVFSVALHITNSLLLARFISALRGRRGVGPGLLAGAIFLIAPAKFEAIIWTFFSYKLFAVTLILMLLIMYENYLKTQNAKTLYISSFLLLLTWLFYESALPLGFILILRGYMTFKKSKPLVFQKIFIVLCSCYILYVILNMIAQSVIPKIYDLYLMPINFSRVAEEALYSLWRWVSHGIVLANSGVRYVFHGRGLLTFEVKDSFLMYTVAFIIWGTLFSSIKYKRSFNTPLLYMFLLLSAGSVLVWLGRTATNGMNYLDGMSIYQYYPTLFLAGMLGLLLHETMDDAEHLTPRRWLPLVSATALIILMGFSSYFIIPRYMRWNKPTSDFLERMKKTIQLDPKVKFDTFKVKFPFTPTHAIPYPEHAYQITKLLFKDHVIRRDEMEQLKKAREIPGN